MDKENKNDEEGQGYLWHETDSSVSRKGSFTLQGNKHYGSIVKSHNAKGESKYEFMVSVGLLFLNEDKRSERSPDMGGKITFNGKQYKLGCWAKQSEQGTPFTSLGFDELDEEGDSVNKKKPRNLDEVPF